MGSPVVEDLSLACGSGRLYNFTDHLGIFALCVGPLTFIGSIEYDEQRLHCDPILILLQSGALLDDEAH